MTRKRNQYTMQFKFTVALEAAKEARTVNQIAGEYGLHPNQVSIWKKQLLADGPDLFRRKNDRGDAARAAQETALYEQIGRLKMELEWLKKKAASFSG